MTNKPDWADEIAAQIEMAFVDGKLGFDVEQNLLLMPVEFAAAHLREAKADERGEISDRLRELMFIMENGNDRALLDDFIESLASAM